MNEIETIVNQINGAQKAYYDGKPIMTDEEFDVLRERLEDLDPENPILKEVGSDSIFEKVTHISPMGSQSKARNPEEFKEWWNKNYSGQQMLVEYKYDGISAEMQYKEGKLATVVTRGNGTVGDCITENAKKMKGVPSMLKSNFTGAVRGEILISHEDFKKYFSDKKNCRNAASGAAKQKDGSDCCHLSVVSYNVWDLSQEINTEMKAIDFLKENGFISHTPKIVTSADEVIAERNNLPKIREEIGFDMDGLVIKPNKIDFEDLKDNPRPKSQVAIKPDLEMAVATVKDIIWNRTGRTYTPIAVMEPVQLNGTTVQRATLCNPDFMKKLGIKVGSLVEVVKRGEIIPKIERVIG